MNLCLIPKIDDIDTMHESVYSKVKSLVSSSSVYGVWNKGTYTETLSISMSRETDDDVIDSFPLTIIFESAIKH
jgi:hypothetical protein